MSTPITDPPSSFNGPLKTRTVSPPLAIPATLHPKPQPEDASPNEGSSKRRWEKMWKRLDEEERANHGINYACGNTPEAQRRQRRWVKV